MQRSFLSLLVFSLTACSVLSGHDRDAQPTVSKPRSPYGSALSFTGELQTFDSCSAVEEWLRAEAKKQTAYEFALQKYYYFNEVFAHPEAVDDKAGTVASEATTSNSTSTNNQVAGVDEADAMKQVGDYLYTLGTQTFNIVKSWPATDLAVLGSVKLPYVPESMLLTQQHAMVFAANAPIGAFGPTMPADQETRWTLIDISNPQSPSKIRDDHRSGMLRTARQIGDWFYLVVETSPQLPPRYQSYLNLYDTQERKSVAAVDSLIHQQLATNEKELASWTLENWIGVAATLRANDCQSLYRPSAGAALAITQIIASNPATQEEKTVALTAHADEVYASTDSLYLTNRFYGGEEGPFTFIHKFSIDVPGAPAYVASGRIGGTVLNQFAFDEYQEHLRVAVTDVDSQFQSVNRVVVLHVQDRSLAEVGRTPDLAQDERIYSVRFEGDKGYMVTFRQVDPLFTLDLSDPAHPEVRGELKIPGVSTYLHNIGNDQLIGVGRENGYLKFSLFDVSDFAAPVELDNLLLQGWTDVEWDHHAFAYAPWRQTLAVTRNSYSNRGISLVQVANNTVKQLKFIAAPQDDSGWMYNSNSLRSAFRENVFYSLSSSGVNAYDLDQNVSVIKQVTLP